MREQFIDPKGYGGEGGEARVREAGDVTEKGSVSQGTSQDLGTTLIPPSFMLALTETLPSQRFTALSQ